MLIEYDGFEYHFKDREAVESYNYAHYYTEEHLYREKILESYGYQFLRLNRFNVSINPVDYINTSFLGY